MANGYLGKISAVVSASTGDFDSKLAKSAKEVANFASRVQGNLTSASTQAARALESIYTPLQKVERSLRAAESLKLSFKGFKGLIGDVDTLQRRLQDLNQRQIDIVLKTTGLKSITEFREAINGLSSKDVEIITRVGGLEKLKELRGQISSSPAVMKVAADVEAAKERIQTLKQEIKSAVDSGGKVTVPVDDAAVQKLEAKLTKATAALKKLQDQAAAGGGGSRELDAINEQLDELYAKRARLEEKAVRVRGDERELQSVNAAIDGISEKIDSLEKKQAKVAKLNISTEEFKAQVDEAQEKVNRLNAALEKAKSGGNVVDIKAKYDELSEAEKEYNKLTRQLNKKVTAQFGVDVDVATLDDLAKKAETAGAVLEKLPRVMEELGRSDLAAATTKMRQMVSQSEELSKPIAAATQQFGTLTREVQAGFLPALVSVQSDLESLNTLIESGVAPTKAIEAAFNGVKERVDQTVASVSRLAEASAKAGKIKTGRELVFDQPVLSETLDRGAAIGEKATALPASALQANPRIASSLAEVNRLAQEATARYAKLQAVIAENLPTGPAQFSLDLIVKELQKAQAVAENEIQIHLDTVDAQKKADELAAKITALRERAAFVITGRPQNLEQADSLHSQLEGQVSGLDRSQRQDFGGLLDEAAVAREKTDLEGFIDILLQIKARLADKQRLQITTDEAAARLKAVNDSLRAIGESLGPPKPLEQLKVSAQEADAAVKKLADGIEKTRLQANIGQLKVGIAAAETLPEGPAKDQAIENAASQAGRISQDAAAVAEESARVTELDTRIRLLNEAWSQSVRGLPEAEAQIDSFFKGTLADIGKLNIADRISLDPLIGEIVSLIQSGAGISEITQKLLELEAATKSFADADKVSNAISKLSPTTARNDLEARFEAAKAAATSPIPLASPTDTVESISKETDLRGSLGKDLADSSRQLSVLSSGIVTLKGQIDTLPAGVRERFIPAIRDAENEFVRLSLAPEALPEQIEDARRRVQQLSADATRAIQAMNFQQSFGGAGAAGINLGLDQRALQGYNAQLTILQGYISRISVEASGPAVAAFNQLRNAIAAAFEAGTINSEETKKELDSLLQATARTTAALAGVGVGGISRDLQRAGDIGRRGLDNWSLAANQAAFAVDDFLSSTGGLEFKLRAVSNNITQLAFILGGTTGLFIGLGAVIAGQLAVGLIKWINNGRSAEDQTKALNEALARQKSLVDELAEAFKSLGESASQGIFSEQAKAARDFARDIENILKKQKELEFQRVAEKDPETQRQRAEQNKLRGQIEKETNPLVRAAKQRQLEQAEEAERRQRDRINDRPLPTADEIKEAVRLRAPRLFRQDAENIPDGNDIRSRRQQAKALRPAVNRLKDIVAEGPSAFDFGLRFNIASRQLEVLGGLLDQLDRVIGDGIVQAATDIAKSAQGPAEQIRQAQEEVAAAIEAGLPGAREFGHELDAVGERLAAAYKKLEAVVSGKDEAGNPIDAAGRERLNSEAQAEINALQAERARIAGQADAFRYERTVDPQRQIAARINRAQSNLGAAGLDEGRIARRLREIENERETIRQRAKLPEFQAPEVQRGLQDLENALNEEAAAIEATTIAVKAFAAALDRASEEAKGNLSSAQQAADEARRADLANSTPQTQETRRRVEADLERQRELEQKAQTEVAVQKDKLEQAAASPEAARIQQIDEELKSGRDKNSDGRERLVGERAVVAAQVERDKLPADDAVAKARDVEQQLRAANKKFAEAYDRVRDKANEIGAGEGTAGDKAVRKAGAGDLVDASDAAFDELIATEKRLGLDLQAARKNLAAALERQAQVANEGAAKLAEIDAQIAAVPEGVDRESLIREREGLKAKMDEDARKNAEQVAAARDASTREAEQAKAAGRGEELARSPEERFKTETQQGLADIQTYFERRAEDNNGLRPKGDAEAQAAAEEKFRKDREREARTATPAGRGEELGLTERERRKKDFQLGAGADINARAKELRDQGVDPTKFLQQSFKNQAEQVAPLFTQFAEERQNALLQGPSRAALNVSDVSTSQGASELTRLIRGDDSAKDVNLAELKKQSGYLEDIRNDLKANNPGVLL
jgi:DNA repair exonuclease SbcCD ATPase subunit